MLKALHFVMVGLTFVLITACQPHENNHEMTIETNHTIGQYADINGLHMYYEIHGNGQPLVLIHGGGSTIETSFSRMIPLLADSNQLICVELQAHGHTGDRPAEISFEQDADDVAALLHFLKIEKADIFGFSNGGNTALLLAIRHPSVCRKIVAASPLLKREGAPAQFWEFMNHGTFEQMPQAYKDAYLKVNPDTAGLMNMYNKCAYRMNHFQNIPDEQLKAIKAPVLLVNGDADVATSEHMAAMSKLIPGCHLAIFPGGHGEYMGEINTPAYSSNNDPLILAVLTRFLGTSQP